MILFDSSVISFVDSWPRSLAGFMHVLSFVGQPAVTIAILAVIGLYGLYRRKRFFVAASIAALVAFGVNSLIKIIVHRERLPTYTAPDSLIYSYSFPSGHAAGTVLAYGLLAYILWRKFTNIYARIAIVSIAFLLAIGVGISRIYLGDHYPTDVIAGWFVGVIGMTMIVWKVK